jgi:2-polyprenyl-3-methyl-5-hydroxy-6-metoxy-1,4-benzoquinol methylase
LFLQSSFNRYNFCFPSDLKHLWRDNMSQPNWNATLYDNQLSFVSTVGKSLMELIQPLPEKSILHLGCGTGDLTMKSPVTERK